MRNRPRKWNKAVLSENPNTVSYKRVHGPWHRRFLSLFQEICLSSFQFLKGHLCKLCWPSGLIAELVGSCGPVLKWPHLFHMHERLCFFSLVSRSSKFFLTFCITAELLVELQLLCMRASVCVFAVCVFAVCYYANWDQTRKNRCEEQNNKQGNREASQDLINFLREAKGTSRIYFATTFVLHFYLETNILPTAYVRKWTCKQWKEHDYSKTHAFIISLRHLFCVFVHPGTPVPQPGGL